LNIKSTERFSSSCCTEREAIKYSKHLATPKVDFEPNRGEIVFDVFLPKKATLTEINYGPFLFLPGPIYEQNTSETRRKCSMAFKVIEKCGDVLVL